MSKFVDIHTHSPLCSDSIIGLRSIRLGLGSLPAEGDFSLGIHPWDCALLHPTLRQQFEALERSVCKAIGEVGIDKVCDVDLALQGDIFDAQVKLAVRADKPLIIHCVRAFNEVLDVLKKYACKNVIFHGFIGSKELLQSIISRGYFASFGWGILRSPKTLEALKICPLENMFLESDTSDQPIEELYTQVARLMDIDREELKEKIYNNYKRIFTL